MIGRRGKVFYCKCCKKFKICVGLCEGVDFRPDFLRIYSRDYDNPIVVQEDLE